MESSIMRERPTIKFSDVAGLDAAKHLLSEAVILPLKLPELYVGPTRPWRGILLSGPPGTGKSYLAKAVAGEAVQTTFLTVSNADLTSKWVGESEKLVKSLFETARAHRPSVVFIDEIDALVSARGQNESESGRRIKTEFLVQMDGVGVNNEGVVIIAATNTPWDLDQAMLRRFERRIYVPLPDAAARRELVRSQLREASHELSASDIEKIASKTDGYSGADLATLIRDALMQPIREFESATAFVQRPGTDLEGRARDGLWTVLPSGLGSMFTFNVRKCKWDELPKEDLARPVACARHFDVSLGQLRPSVDRKFLSRYDQWTREVGESGV
jgi:vacuolar protein-sorting-associated protein 4